MKSYYSIDQTLNAYIISKYKKLPNTISFSSSRKISGLKEITKNWKLEQVDVRKYDSGGSNYTEYNYLYRHPRNLIDIILRKDPIFIKFNEIVDYDNKQADDFYNYSNVILYHNNIFNPKHINIYNQINNLEVYKGFPINNLYLTAQRPDGSLFLREFKIKNKIEVDLDLNYNDDFKEIHKLVEDKIMSSDKGLIMFHGLPGTGKTSYVKWFLQNTPKKVIFMPPYLATQLSSPGFINFIADACKDSLLVIEDAEEILASRNAGGNMAISNLLNITDGLLSDIFNIQILATFNCKISEVDEALRRKGRIIAEYEFKELSIDKAQKLSDKLGFNKKITKPIVLTDVFNQSEKDFQEKKVIEKVGFIRQHTLLTKVNCSS